MSGNKCVVDIKQLIVADNKEWAANHPNEDPIIYGNLWDTSEEEDESSEEESSEEESSEEESSKEEECGKCGQQFKNGNPINGGGGCYRCMPSSDESSEEKEECVVAEFCYDCGEECVEGYMGHRDDKAYCVDCLPRDSEVEF